MHFSEDDLKKALRRKHPGPAFTQRVMARVNQQQQAEAAKASQPARLLRWRWAFASHPALAGALAALGLVVGSGLGYLEYQHVQAQKQIAAENAAKQKVVEALKFTNSK